MLWDGPRFAFDAGFSGLVHAVRVLLLLLLMWCVMWALWAGPRRCVITKNGVVRYVFVVGFCLVFVLVFFSAMSVPGTGLGAPLGGAWDGARHGSGGRATTSWFRGGAGLTQRVCNGAVRGQEAEHVLNNANTHKGTFSSADIID